MVQVVEVDGFGNLITNAPLPAHDVRMRGHAVRSGRTFGDVAPGELVIYEDSAGDVAIAVNGGSAAALLDVKTGDELELHEPRRPARASRDDRLDQRPRARARRPGRGARHARDRRRADLGPRPPGPFMGDAGRDGDRRLARAAEFDDLLPLRAGLAVADVAGRDALVKWPNDVWVAGKKVAGILAESRSEPRWAVLGIGVNVAVDVGALPEDAKAVAGTLGKSPEDVEPTLQALLSALRGTAGPGPRRRPERPAGEGRAARRAREWQDGEGTGAGIDDSGALLVTLPNGGQTTLAAGEVTLSARV